MDVVRHLRYFVALAEVRHYGECAQRLGITQPPLSQGIKRLEQHLGVRLFDRGVRGVWLTPAGEALLPRARQLVADAVALAEAARRVAEDVPLRLGLPPDLGARGEEVVRAASGLVGTVEPRVLAGVTLAAQLAEGSLDVAVVRHPAVVDGTDAGPVVRHPAFLHDATGETTAVRLSDVALPVAVLPRWQQPPVHDQLLEGLQRHRHEAGVVVVPDLVTARAVVAAGQAVMLTPDAGTRPLAQEVVPYRWRVLVPLAPRRREEIPYDRLAEDLAAVLGSTP